VDALVDALLAPMAASGERRREGGQAWPRWASHPHAAAAGAAGSAASDDDDDEDDDEEEEEAEAQVRAARGQHAARCMLHASSCISMQHASCIVMHRASLMHHVLTAPPFFTQAAALAARMHAGASALAAAGSMRALLLGVSSASVSSASASSASASSASASASSAAAKGKAAAGGASLPRVWLAMELLCAAEADTLPADTGGGGAGPAGDVCAWLRAAAATQVSFRQHRFSPTGRAT
jgi:hypothetical protein